MKTEQKPVMQRQSMAVNLLILLLIILFFISISMMWLKHDQYHMDGSSMGWMMSDQSDVYSRYIESHVQTEKQ